MLGNIFKGGFFTRTCVINAAPIRIAIPPAPINATAGKLMPTSSKIAHVIFRMPTNPGASPEGGTV